MKRFLTVFVAILLIFVLGACGQSSQPESSDESSDPSSASQAEDEPTKDPDEVEPEEPSDESSAEVVSSTPPASSAAPVPPVSSAAPAVSSQAPVVSSAPESSAASSEPESSVVSSSEPASSAAAQVSAGDGEFLSSTENAILSAVNAERQALGLGSLSYNSALNTAARIRSKELYDNDHWAHTRPDGRNWYTVLTGDSPYTYEVCGENLAYYETDNPSDMGVSSGNRWFQQWKDSPSHYANISKEEFTECGIAVYKVQKDGVYYAYATMIFAKPQ